MSNPFAPANAAVSTTKEDPIGTAGEADRRAAEIENGDPFAGPTGVGAGEKISDMVDRLLLIKPTEIIEEMKTAKGLARKVVRADVAILDDPEEPGRVSEGVLLFQMALKREAAAIYENPAKKYLLGRLQKGETNGGNTLYTFEEFTEEDKALAQQFLAARTL